MLITTITNGTHATENPTCCARNIRNASLNRASAKIAPMATIHQYSPENRRRASRRMGEWKRFLEDSFFGSSIPKTINKTVTNAGRTANHKTCLMSLASRNIINMASNGPRNAPTVSID